MVAEDSPTTNTHSSILHRFIIESSMSRGQNLLASEHFNAYATDLCAFDLLGSVPGPFLQDPQVRDESNEPKFHGQRLSLSLGTWTLLSPQIILRNPCGLIVTSEEKTINLCNSNQSSDYSSNDRTDASALNIGNYKFLRPTQLLLDEAVKVSSNAIDLRNGKYARRLSRSSKRGSLKLWSELKDIFPNNDFCEEKHAPHMQLLKLIALLEEVEKRYEQYHHHMEELVTSFESVAGLGAGGSYTALTLDAMSRHFCSLRDAISSQILATRQDLSSKIGNGMSQLSLFEQESRRNLTSLQQIGMIQNSKQVWRPVRGLPETSVTILRSWLFEHFLHPYPTHYEKLMLASQTGLNKNQISNWFINARVRLWKPMIEEMYKEEFAEFSVESNPSLTQEGFGDSTQDKGNH